MDNDNDNDSTANYSRDESTAHRLDRNYEEMLQEVRVAQIGTQILFAFLLGIAFQQRFSQITSLQRTVYIVTLVFTAAAAALLTAPVAVHRAVFRRRRKDRLVTVTNQLQIGGMAAMAVSLLGAVLLIVDYVLGLTAALIIDGGLAVLLGYLWVLLPLMNRRGPAREDVPGRMRHAPADTKTRAGTDSCPMFQTAVPGHESIGTRTTAAPRS